MLKKQLIKVIQSDKCINKAKLILCKDNNKIIEADAFIGKKGITSNKVEGDKKTPQGIFELGLVFGTHNRTCIKLNKNIDYMKLNEKLYWIDDINSKYYNKIVDISKVIKDWNSAEHLIKYPLQYEYAIEIKSNINNIPGKGSAIFIHCSVNKPTEGCISIDREHMKKLIGLIEEKTKIYIKSSDID